VQTDCVPTDRADGLCPYWQCRRTVFLLTVQTDCVPTDRADGLCSHWQCRRAVFLLTVQTDCVPTDSADGLCPYWQCRRTVFLLTVQTDCIPTDSADGLCSHWRMNWIVMCSLHSWQPSRATHIKKSSRLWEEKELVFEYQLQTKHISILVPKCIACNTVTQIWLYCDAQMQHSAMGIL
jgi:hypothetical protein